MDLRDVKEFLLDSLKYILVIAGVLLFGIFIVSFQQVVGPSMNDTLTERDVLLINKLIYKIREPKRGEIVTLSKNEKIMIKRIIGLPGESIEYKDNILYINGEKFEDPYASNETEDFNITSLGVKVIPADYYFVLGDNRGDSQDSRDFGLIKKSEIVGRAFIRIYPFSNIKLF